MLNNECFVQVVIYLGLIRQQWPRRHVQRSLSQKFTLVFFPNSTDCKTWSSNTTRLCTASTREIYVTQWLAHRDKARSSTMRLHYNHNFVCMRSCHFTATHWIHLLKKWQHLCVEKYLASPCILPSNMTMQSWNYYLGILVQRERHPLVQEAATCLADHYRDRWGEIIYPPFIWDTMADTDKCPCHNPSTSTLTMLPALKPWTSYHAYVCTCYLKKLNRCALKSLISHTQYLNGHHYLSICEVQKN